jgi:hypothetical protein
MFGPINLVVVKINVLKARRSVVNVTLDKKLWFTRIRIRDSLFLIATFYHISLMTCYLWSFVWNFSSQILRFIVPLSYLKLSHNQLKKYI